MGWDEAMGLRSVNRDFPLCATEGSLGRGMGAGGLGYTH